MRITLAPGAANSRVSLTGTLARREEEENPLIWNGAEVLRRQKIVFLMAKCQILFALVMNSWIWIQMICLFQIWLGVLKHQQ